MRINEEMVFVNDEWYSEGNLYDVCDNLIMADIEDEMARCPEASSDYYGF